MSKDGFNWTGLEGDTVSILIDNPKPNGGKESYVGKVKFVGEGNEGFLFLETPHNDKIKAIIIRKSLIISIWLYK